MTVCWSGGSRRRRGHPFIDPLESALRTGYWTIRAGAGPLAGLHAQGEMTFVACTDVLCTYALSGTYLIAP